jgi:hypothetical protein
MLEFLIDNIFVSFGGTLFQQVVTKGLLNVRKWTSKPGFKELVLLKC